MNDIQKLIELLQHHPDASRPAGDGDKARTVGLQSVQVFATGELRILWHWGAISFGPDEVERFNAYLRHEG
jgi:hypothetical protein